MAAGEQVRHVGKPLIADDVHVQHALRAAISGEHAWVAQVSRGVSAYVVAEVLDGNAHVCQVSVDPACRGRGATPATPKEPASTCGTQ